MNQFDDELEAVLKIYEIISPFGMGGATRIWNYLSLRLQAEAIAKEYSDILESQRTTPRTPKN